MQSDELPVPAAEDEPGGQTLHCDKPSLSANEPAGHKEQDEEPTRGAKLPLGQIEQLDAPAGANHPFGQLAHPCTPARESSALKKVPTLHWVHAASPIRDHIPPPQSEQADARPLPLCAKPARHVHERPSPWSEVVFAKAFASSHSSHAWKPRAEKVPEGQS
jgi:hypothetical protein